MDLNKQNQLKSNWIESKLTFHSDTDAAAAGAAAASAAAPVFAIVFTVVSKETAAEAAASVSEWEINLVSIQFDSIVFIFGNLERPGRFLRPLSS